MHSSFGLVTNILVIYDINKSPNINDVMRMSAMGRKRRTSKSALRQFKLTYRPTFKIVCYKADVYKRDCGS